MTDSREWTPEDDKFLAILWDEGPEITGRLPTELGRSREEIDRRAQELGLSAGPESE